MIGTLLLDELREDGTVEQAEELLEELAAVWLFWPVRGKYGTVGNGIRRGRFPLLLEEDELIDGGHSDDWLAEELLAPLLNVLTPLGRALFAPEERRLAAEDGADPTLSSNASCSFILVSLAVRVVNPASIRICKFSRVALILSSVVSSIFLSMQRVDGEIVNISMMKVFLSPLAEFKLDLLLKYLVSEWGNNSKKTFFTKLKSTIDQISKFPESNFSFPLSLLLLIT